MHILTQDIRSKNILRKRKSHLFTHVMNHALLMKKQQYNVYKLLSLL